MMTRYNTPALLMLILVSIATVGCHNTKKTGTELQDLRLELRQMLPTFGYTERTFARLDELRVKFGNYTNAIENLEAEYIFGTDTIIDQADSIAVRYLVTGEIDCKEAADVGTRVMDIGWFMLSDEDEGGPSSEGVGAFILTAAARESISDSTCASKLATELRRVRDQRKHAASSLPSFFYPFADQLPQKVREAAGVTNID